MSWIDPFSDGKTVFEFFANLVTKTPLKGDLRINNLEVRLAQDQADVEAAQRLRYRVFYEEMAAQASAEQAATGRDIEPLDAVCDHMLVIDHNKTGSDAIVGTYRMLRRSVADQQGSGFYSASEYDISKILAHPGELLEVGRSCVDINYRTRPTLELLWRGIASYVDQFDVQLIFGCASFATVNPDDIKDELAYLYHHHLAPPALRATALPTRIIPMDKVDPKTINPRRALSKLPPLIKGYLRIGGFVGDGAVLDSQWGSIDVCIIVKTDLITDKHAKHFGLGENVPDGEK